MSGLSEELLHKLNVELRHLEAGLCGYMMSLNCNDPRNDILLEKLNNCIRLTDPTPCTCGKGFDPDCAWPGHKKEMKG